MKPCGFVHSQRFTIHRDDDGENVLSTDRCQELVGCRWDRLSDSDGFGCIREVVSEGVTKNVIAKNVDPSCPSTTVATFAGLVGPDQFAV